jgi:hypothetical protein
MAISDSGDGVVKMKSKWLFTTTSPKSMSEIFLYRVLSYMDLGTPPEPGGEIFCSLNHKWITKYQKTYVATSE